MKAERTIEFYPTETSIGMADHLLCLCKMMEAATSDVVAERPAAYVA